MKKELFLQSLICLLAVSCSVREIDVKNEESNESDVFYASLESYSDSDTRVYVDEHIKILWDADDRITIFNENTMNQQYRFTGDTGDNSGFFKKVPNDDFATGNDMDFICAVYPYLEATSIDNSGVLTLNLSEVQSYREDSFGPGANTMVSSTEDNLLKFKNVGGYLVLKFYGEDVSVSSIMLEGHNGEKLSGTATVKPAVGVIPNITMASTSGTSITLTCDDPVELGTTREDASIFWMVVPPTAFTDGFKLTVTDPDGRVYVKETNADLSIVRNGVLRIAPIEVVLSEPVLSNNVIYYTSTDGNVVTPYATDVFGANIVSNEYVDGQGILTFDGSILSIGREAFKECSNLASISIPEGVTEIGAYAFYQCKKLTSITLPESLNVIGGYSFCSCHSLLSIVLPENLTSIGARAFYACKVLSSVNIPEGVTKINQMTFYACFELHSIIIPENVTSIGVSAFDCCRSLSTLTIPKSVISIGHRAFAGCTGLTSLFSYASNPPTGNSDMFTDTNDCPIYVVSESLMTYKEAPYWSDYADRIQAIPTPTPEAVDLGLSVKWATFNLGASHSTDLGSYFSWAETTPKSIYNDETYKWWIYTPQESQWYTIQKYVFGGTYYSIHSNETADFRYVVLPEDDAATIQLGEEWRIPTSAEAQELINKCEWTWISNNNGVSGYIITSKEEGYTNMSIFLPLTGYKWVSNLEDSSSHGIYWLADLYVNDPISAYSLHLFNPSYNSSLKRVSGNTRSQGSVIRPVFGKRKVVTSLKVNKSELEMEMGQTVNLSATITPSDAPGVGIIWKSSDNSIITVTNYSYTGSIAIVEAIASGEATIIAESVDSGIQATCHIQVR